MTNITTWIDEYHKGSRFGLNGEILIKQKSKICRQILVQIKSQMLLKITVFSGKISNRFLKS